jgi:hypothetical protein
MNTDKINKIITVNRFTDTLDEGIWLCGNNKGIKISEIDDEEYLQKILYTLQSREAKAIERYRDSMNIVGSLYSYVLTRMKEKNMKIKVDFTPVMHDMNFVELKSFNEYLVSLLSETKETKQ